MYIKLRVITNAKKEVITEETPDHFLVYLKEKPERNMANRRIISIFRERFYGKGKDVRIVSGHHSPSKIISVD